MSAVAIRAALVLGAYLLGSIPFGVLLGRAKGVDIRSAGSGNIGATNVARLLGRRLGILCFALDAAKGAVPVLLAGAVIGALGTPVDALPEGRLGPPQLWTWLLVAAAALTGHMCSPWLGFRGGKGVATGFGAMVAMWPAMTVAALLALGTWIVVVVATRIVSLASIIASLVLPLVVAAAVVLAATAAGGGTALDAARQRLPLLVITVALAAFVVYRHRANIARLRAGTEPRIGAGRRDGS